MKVPTCILKWDAERLFRAMDVDLENDSFLVEVIYRDNARRKQISGFSKAWNEFLLSRQEQKATFVSIEEVDIDGEWDEIFLPAACSTPVVEQESIIVKLCVLR